MSEIPSSGAVTDHYEKSQHFQKNGLSHSKYELPISMKIQSPVINENLNYSLIKLTKLREEQNPGEY